MKSDLLSYIGRVLLLLSVLFNFYLINLSLNTISVEQCFAVNQEYKKLFKKETDKLKDCLDREYLIQMQNTSRVHTTTSYPKYEEELKKKHTEPCLSLQKINDTYSNNAFIKHCLTGDIIAKVDLNVTKNFDIDINFEYFYKKENEANRVKSFEKIFESTAWGKNWDPSFHGLSASGAGSTLEWSQEIIAVLHSLINSIKKNKPPNTKVRVLDVPCGDMVWMGRFLKSRDDIDYTGIDIVSQLIDHHRKKFKETKFYLEDIVEIEKLAQYDIIISRMFLQHLYTPDILKVLKLFSKSKSTYLVMTTFPKLNKNFELSVTKENPGRYRPVNLELPPYSISHPVCYSVDGPVVKDHYIAVWKLPLTFQKDCENNFYKNSGKSKKNKKYFTCSKMKLMKHFSF